MRRIFRFSPVLLAFCLAACGMFHHAPGPTPSMELESKPGLVGVKPSGKGLVVEIKASPDPVKLGETREMNVTLTLRNPTKQPVDLKFATSQTIEILLRDPASDKVLSQWSADRTFQDESRYLVVNPGERIEYNEPITTRELQAGRTYQLEAYFIGYDKELHASRPLIPLP